MFSEGYNRRETGLRDASIHVLSTGPTGYVIPDKLLHTNTSKEGGTQYNHKNKASQINSKKDKDTLEKEIESLTKRAKHVQEPQIISQVYDQKNQLSSLIKNAAMNKDALEKRNERVQKSKKLSRSRYGW